MNLDGLIKFARTYDKLGWAIQQQLDDVVDGNYTDVNPNAMQEISKTLKGYNEDLDAIIDEASEAVERLSGDKSE